MADEKARRNREMFAERHIDKMTLEEIAHKHGVSRQRVGQILGSTGYIATADRILRLTKKARLLREAGYSAKDAADVLGVSYTTVIKHTAGMGYTNNRPQRLARNEIIKQERASGKKYREIAENFGLHIQYIIRICAGEFDVQDDS